MIYTKRKFGFDLKSKNKENPAISGISAWAFDLYNSPNIEFENGLDRVLFKLIAMEEGPEFCLSPEKIDSLADELIFSEQQKKIKLNPDELRALRDILSDFCAEIHVNSTYEDQKKAAKILDHLSGEESAKTDSTVLSVHDLNLIIKIIDEFINKVHDDIFESYFGITKYQAKELQGNFF